MEQVKNFNKWNEYKQKLNQISRGVLFHEREIWWCSLGINIGHEQDGKNELFERPVLILAKFNREMLWVLPLTRTDRESKYYLPVTVRDQEVTVILSQLRLVSSKRLLRYMHKLSKSQFRTVVSAVQKLLSRT